jgi:FkbM family methyltransferase
VIDGGANAGLHALPIAALLGLTGHLHCFEPIPSIAAGLANNLYRAGLLSRCSIHGQALSDADATTEFFVNEANPALSHIRNKFIDSDSETIAVPTRKIDTVVGEEALAFVKLDLEGADFLAIRGAINTIRRSLPIIVFENSRKWAARCYGYEKEEFFGLFDELDYRIIDLHGRELRSENWEDPDLAFEFLAASCADPRWDELLNLIENFWASMSMHPIIGEWRDCAAAVRDPIAYLQQGGSTPGLAQSSRE